MHVIFSKKKNEKTALSVPARGLAAASLPPLPEGDDEPAIVIPRETELNDGVDRKSWLEQDKDKLNYVPRGDYKPRRARARPLPRSRPVRRRVEPTADDEEAAARAWRGAEEGVSEEVWRSNVKSSRFARDPLPQLSYSAYFARNRLAMDRIARQTCHGWKRMWACIGMACTEQARRAALDARLDRWWQKRVAYIGCGDACVLKDITPPSQAMLIRDPLVVSRASAAADATETDVSEIMVSDADPLVFEIDAEEKESMDTAAAKRPIYDTVVVGLVSCLAMLNPDMARTVARNVDVLLGPSDDGIVCVLSYDFEVLEEISRAGGRRPFESIKVSSARDGDSVVYSIRAGTRFRGSIDAFNQVVAPKADLLGAAMTQVDLSCIARTNVGLLIDEGFLPVIENEPLHAIEWPHLLQFSVYSRSLVP